MNKRLVATALFAVLCAVTSGCAPGEPSTKEEVCTAYDDLGKQIVAGNLPFLNQVFHLTEALADVADRYAGTPSLGSDADKLHDIADSDSTTNLDLMNATTSIADLCGHPLGLSF